MKWMKMKVENRTFFEEEVWPHFEHVERFIYTITLNRGVSTEITQEAMFVAWKNVERVKTYTRLSAALRQIAKNALMDYYSKNKLFLSALNCGEEPLEYISEPGYVDTELDNQECISGILLLCNRMKKEWLQVVLLRDYYDMPLKDVAKLLGLNYNTAVTYHKRALLQMKEALTDTEYDTRERKTEGR